jgi:hypothetical protein
MLVENAIRPGWIDLQEAQEVYRFSFKDVGSVLDAACQAQILPNGASMERWYHPRICHSSWILGWSPMKGYAVLPKGNLPSGEGMLYS